LNITSGFREVFAKQKFGEMASRAISLIIPVKWPDDRREESAAWCGVKRSK